MMTTHPLQRGLLMLLLIFTSMVFLLPLLLLTWQAITGEHPDGHLTHLWQTWLGEAIGNSLLLTLLSTLGACVLGTGLAWITLVFRFPGSQWLSWLFVLPLAFPPYVVAMIFIWWGDSGGSLHLWLRELGWVNHWWSITNLLSLALLFSLVFMPYVFLLVRASLQRQGLQAFDAARALGLSPIRAFFRVVLPILKPAIIAGGALTAMETLADYGASSLFSVPTLTQAIYRSWFNLGDWVLAGQLAVTLITCLGLLLWLIEPDTQHIKHQKTTPVTPTRLQNPAINALLTLSMWSIFGLIFLLPFALLLWQGTAHWQEWHVNKLLIWFEHSLTLALLTALLTSSIALFAVWQAHVAPSPWRSIPLRLLSLGYAIPGTALAVAVLMTWQTFGLSAGIMALVFAYMVRFMSLSLQSTQAGLAQLSPRLLEAAQLHGYPAWQRHWRITIPLLSPHLFAGSLMVAIEVLKELPATLMMRPFNYDTLAIITYQYSQDERIPEASSAALLMVLAGLVGLLVIRWLERKHA